MNNLGLRGLLQLHRIKALSNNNQPLRSLLANNNTNNRNSLSTYFGQTQKTPENTLPDGQLRYSTNKKWHAIMNFVNKPKDTPPYQYQVVIVCTLITAIYFAFFRGRSELDDVLDQNFENFHKQRLKQK
ncbi:unnamed protein product [Trichobilharzia regenti]|uniref:Uncharacterized protein n=1 Tax=Trichobilharzia regenti TaxID=157069 RepID=A0A183WNY7_TRIRE|nr:unnamed protein product [Trichobilharzia regenti]VDQ09719.1 unnamed protein product [Trichobilharzia regenti]